MMCCRGICCWSFIQSHWETLRWGIAAIISGFLLFVSFVPYEYDLCAYIAIVPLLMMSAYATPSQNFRFGWLSGFLFWLGTLFWLVKVSVLGWILLSAYCALYMGVFLMLTSWWWRRGMIFKNINHPKWLLLTPAIWVGLEYLRGIDFSISRNDN